MSELRDASEAWWGAELRDRYGIDFAGAAPLHATRRDWSRYSEGPAVAAIAAALGTPLIPWQRYAADVIGERLPNGEYAYQVVVISVPRQSGKTTELRAVGAHRCLVCGRDAFYTAQTGKDARARWGDLAKAIELSPLKGRVIVRRAAGQERVVFPGGAAFQAFAPTPESLHGYTPPLVMLDEAFAHDERTGDLLMGAIGPAQLTIVDRQIVIVSTQGTAESVFLNTWLAKAIDGTPRVAVLFWGADDDEDPYDPADVARFHPAVGFTINGKRIEPAHVIAEAANNTRAEYERAYANRRTLTKAHTIPAELLRPLRQPKVARPALRDLVLSYDAGELGSTILATWREPASGVPYAKVVMAAAGSEWLAGQVVDLAERWKPRAVAAHDVEPTRAITDVVERAGVDVTKVKGADWATATGAMLAAIRAQRWRFDGSDQLAHAFAGVGLVRDGDGAKFLRHVSVGDVSSAFAATVGAWVLDHVPTNRPNKPELSFGR